MVGSFISRTRRLVEAKLETAIGAAEQKNAAALMRQALRDLDSGIEDLHQQRSDAQARQANLVEERARLQVRLGTLADEARFALDHRRDDLAEAALVAKLAVQQILGEHDASIVASEQEIAGLAASIREAQARRDSLSVECKGADPTPSMPTRVSDTRIDRAEQAFRQAQALNGAATYDATALAELAKLRKERAVAEELAALRASQITPKPSRRKSRRD